MLTLDEYNLALQQVRINKLPDGIKVRVCALMLAGFKFKLNGCELRSDDQFHDLWDCTTPDGISWMQRDLEVMIVAAEQYLKHCNKGELCSANTQDWFSHGSP